MTPIALVSPAGEPVFAAEARLYLRLDAGDEGELLATLIAAARRSATRSACSTVPA